ncbi:outer membrane beta-barrel protein [Persicitalea sp.]|uniref:outer membrane beta-barrel protein n=1 Tax=Persicitalea sp. TaxID=3100273 RepID=UPI00359472B4
MTRYLAIICLLLMMSLEAEAQSKFSGGLFLSPFSSYAGEPLDIEASSRYSTGALLGMALHYNLSPNWSLSSGILYESARVRYGLNGVCEDSYIVRKNNATVPLLINFRSTSKKVSPYLSAGMLVSTNKNERASIRAILGAGLSYQVDSRWSIVAQPAFTLGANSKTDGVLFPKNRQLSIQTQLLYRFSGKSDQ